MLKRIISADAKLLSIILCVMVATSACQTLPTGGPVTAFELKENTSESLVLKGFGPVEHAEPDTIVRDFLRAMAAGWSDDFQVARSYLTEAAQKDWKPDSSVYVYSDDYTPILSYNGEDKITAATRIHASITKDGDYRIEKTNSVYTSDFQLVKTAAGQWRINNLPDGVIVSESSFRAAFQHSAVFFPSSDKRTLIADHRWFPRRRLASYLMQSILSGPSAAIAPAVINAAPEGAVLPLQNVEVKDSVAEVSVEGSGLGTEEAQLLFKWQVTATLLQVPNVSEVQLRINGVLVTEQPVPTSPQWALDNVVSVAKDGIIREREGKRETVVSTTQIGDGKVSFPARGPLEDSLTAFVLDGKKLMVIPRSGQPVEIFEADQLSAPSVDRANWSWTVSKGKIVVLRAGTEPIIFTSPWGAEVPIASVQVSPDGARLLVQRGGVSPSVGVMAIRRSIDARPVSLGDFEFLPTGAARVVDATWVGNDMLAVLLAEGDTRQVLVSHLGSAIEKIRAPERAARISGGASLQFLLVETDEGKYFMRSGSLWNALISDAKYRAFPR